MKITESSFKEYKIIEVLPFDVTSCKLELWLHKRGKEEPRIHIGSLPATLNAIEMQVFRNCIDYLLSKADLERALCTN